MHAFARWFSQLLLLSTVGMKYNELHAEDQTRLQISLSCTYCRRAWASSSDIYDLMLAEPLSAPIPLAQTEWNLTLERFGHT